ncbi:MAG: Vitamin B12 dependent methionine synthase, activation domain [Deltaproteobacteria bacterium ADurb.Bin072]|nr:MAG: Vitamin B12 dependent methionine synthase, activation domain [Deltaproteobacteria bacterium ADurb.Bin072]
MADAALDWIMDYAGQDLLRSSRRLTRKRFSAGYGDFSLENQQTMFDMLQLGEIGIRMTPAKVLIPEKSVTAVAGVLRLT